MDTSIKETICKVLCDRCNREAKVIKRVFIEKDGEKVMWYICEECFVEHYWESAP